MPKKMDNEMEPGSTLADIHEDTMYRPAELPMSS